MPRLSYVEADAAPPDVKATYEKLQAAQGRVSNFMKILAHHPKGLEAVAGMFGGVRAGKLDPKLRQLAYLAASRINGCHY
jgi:alkylhydroperoxidase family enzyme